MSIMARSCAVVCLKIKEKKQINLSSLSCSLIARKQPFPHKMMSEKLMKVLIFLTDLIVLLISACHGRNLLQPRRSRSGQQRLVFSSDRVGVGVGIRSVELLI